MLRNNSFLGLEVDNFVATSSSFLFLSHFVILNGLFSCLIALLLLVGGETYF